MGAWLGLVIGLVGIGSPSVRAPDGDYVIQVWDARHGMPQSSATSIAQTPDGHLWVGTFGGLVRFDGVDFKVHTSRDTPALHGDDVVLLYPDSRGRVWVSTGESLAVVDDDCCRTIPAEGIKGPLSSIAEDQDGHIVISTPERRIYRREGGAFVELVAPPPLPGEEIDQISLARDTSGVVFAERGKTIYRLQGSRFVRVVDTDALILAIATRNDGGIWVATSDTIYALTNETLVATFERPSREGYIDYIRLFETSDGDVWTASYVDGAVRFRAGTPPWSLTVANGLPHQAIRFVFDDRDNNIWIGTDGGGLARLRRATFESYSDIDGLPQNVVRAVHPARKGGMWVATHGAGVVHFDGDHFTSLPPRNAGKWAWALLEQDDGTLWVGYYGQGVSYLRNGKWVDIPLPGGHELSVRALAETADGRVLVGTHAGLFKVVDDKLIPILEPGSAKPFDVRTLAVVGNKTWIASRQRGVLVLEGDRIDAVAESQISSRGADFVRPDDAGHLWVGYGPGGVALLSDGHLYDVAASSGLPVRRYGDLADDGHGYLWLTSDRGVVRVPRHGMVAVAKHDQPKLAAIELGLEDGMRGIEVNAVDVVSRNGTSELAFSTVRGISLTNPVAFRPDESTRVAILESLRFDAMDDEGTYRPTVRALSKSGQTTFTLPPSAENIEIQYTAPAFFKPQTTVFRHRLEGPDGLTERETNARAVYLHRLGAGTYTLNVSARNAGGIWRDSGVAITLVMQPHWWQAKWIAPSATAMSLLLFGLIAASILSRRFHRIKERLAMEQARARQIEEQERVERRLRDKQRVESLGLLAGSIAHDFNNLLAGVLTNASYLLEEVVDPPSDIAESLEEIIVAANRAADLCGQMLAYSGRGRFVTEPSNISELVDGTIRLIRTTLPTRVELDLALAPDLPLVVVDPGQIRQVIMNLTLNAAQAVGDAPGRVTVKTEVVDRDAATLAAAIPQSDLPAGRYLSVVVSDTGCGMTDTVRKRIFDPFFSTKAAGHGLGLAAVLGIVRGHGGGLLVNSKPNGGSSFELLLPIPKTLPTPKQVPKLIDAPRMVDGHGLVLVVDDIGAVRTASSRMLRRMGFQIVEAENGVEGVERFAGLRDQVRLVLLDLTMPQMTGEEAAAAIRKIKPDQPIIFMSGYDETETIPRLSSDAAVNFIQKPFEFDALSRAVAIALGQTPPSSAAPAGSESSAGSLDA